MALAQVSIEKSTCEKKKKIQKVAQMLLKALFMSSCNAHPPPHTQPQTTEYLL